MLLPNRYPVVMLTSLPNCITTAADNYPDSDAEAVT